MVGQRYSGWEKEKWVGKLDFRFSFDKEGLIKLGQ